MTVTKQESLVDYCFFYVGCTIGPLHNPVIWYGINYAGMQVTQWDFQNKGKSGCNGTTSFVLEVPLCNLRRSIINSVRYDRIVQRAYFKRKLQQLLWKFTLTKLGLNAKHLWDWMKLAKLESFGKRPREQVLSLLISTVFSIQVHEINWYAIVAPGVEPEREGSTILHNCRFNYSFTQSDGMASSRT